LLVWSRRHRRDREIALSRRERQYGGPACIPRAFIQFRELLEVGQLGAERALARFPDCEKTVGRACVRAFVSAAAPRKNSPLERHARFHSAIEDRITRDQNEFSPRPKRLPSFFEAVWKT